MTIEKTITQYSNEASPVHATSRTENARGINVYSIGQLHKITGRDKEGRLISWGVEEPYFYLTVSQRIEIFRLCSPVLGVVTSRMNRLSGLEFNITTDVHEQDRIVQEMQDYKNIYDEYKGSGTLQDLTLRASIYNKLLYRLPELKPDLSNFNQSLLRWKRNLQHRNLRECDNVKNWLMEPNQCVSWTDFVKKWVADYHIHGAAAIYKKEENGVIQNFDVLPGGTVYRIKGEYFSTVAGYVQVLPLYTGHQSYVEPQFYFSDEIVYNEYIPSSSRAYGMIPLEALINKVAETLLFDDMMANQADGTKPPEKIVIVTDGMSNPFGSMDESEKFDIPLDEDEQTRIEEKMNTPVKGAIMSLSGNRAEVIDLSKENTMSIQMQRQKDIREEVALVFNMSNMEVNLTGSSDTSGRATSEAQAEIEQGKGLAPIAKALSEAISRGLIPFKFGTGFVFEWEKSKNEKEEKELDLMALNTGEMTMNEIREKYNKKPFGEEYDQPNQGGYGMGEAGESELNPMFTRSVERNGR